MNSVIRALPMQCLEGLQEAIPTLLESSDFFYNLEQSLQIIGDAFDIGQLFLAAPNPSATTPGALTGLILLERSAAGWQEKLQRSVLAEMISLAEPILHRVQQGEVCTGTAEKLFAAFTPELNINKAASIRLIPLFCQTNFKGLLCLAPAEKFRKLPEAWLLSLDLYTRTLAHWLERYEVFRMVRNERDQLRDIINLGEPPAVKEAILTPSWESSITDAQLLNRKITTTIPDQVFIIDLHDHSNLFSNRPTFLGYELSQIDNPFEFFQQLIHPDDLGPAFDDFFEQLMQAKDDDIIESEYRMHTKSGEVIWFNERVKVFKRDQEGQVWQYLNVLQDITSRKLALEAEAETQQRYRNFITYSSDGIYYMNCGKPIDTQLPVEEQVALYYEHAFIEDANPAIAAMYGLKDVNELLNVRAWDLHKGAHFEVNKASFTALIHHGYRIENVETIEADQDGKVKYFLNHAVGSIINGKLVGVWGTQQDITAKKEAELAKEESDTLFRSLYEKNPLGVVIADAKGNILHCNERFAEMLDYEEEELRSQNFQSITHPEDVETELAAIRKEVRKQQPIMFLEKRYLDRNGRVIWANLSMTLLYNESGALRLAIAMVEDITEKRKILLNMQKSEAFQKAILTTLPDLKFRISREGYYLDYYPSPNDEQDLLVSPAEFLGKKVSDIMPGYIAEAIIKNIELAIGTGELREFEYVLPINGKLHHYEIRISAINKEEVIAVIRNVSERNWAQIQLKDKIRELDEKNKQLKNYIDSNMQLENFAYIASHDLREPLRTMSTFAQLLQKRYNGQLDEAANTYINFVVKGAKDMNNLVEDLLTYSRIETQENPRENIDLAALLEEVISGLKETITENRAMVEFSDLPPQLNANPYRLKQLFQNLIANAIKFRKPDLAPLIRIEGADLGKYWQFAVRDNGIGIDPEFYGKIFLLFKKLHSRQDFQGTGLGLAICKKVVEQMDGEIWVESEVGRGSAFYFTLKKIKAGI